MTRPGQSAASHSEDSAAAGAQWTRAPGIHCTVTCQHCLLLLLLLALLALPIDEELFPFLLLASLAPSGIPLPLAAPAPRTRAHTRIRPSHTPHAAACRKAQTQQQQPPVHSLQQPQGQSCRPWKSSMCIWTHSSSRRRRKRKRHAHGAHQTLLSHTPRSEVACSGI